MIIRHNEEILIRPYDIIISYIYLKLILAWHCVVGLSLGL